MKITLACPNCNYHETIKGKSGKKLILTCSRCGGRGIVRFPQTKKIDVFGMKVTKKQLIVSSIALVLILSIFVSVIIPILQGNLLVLTVLSGSMEPDIQTGDVVFTGKMDPYELKVGDVITFRYSNDPDPNRYITHRVVKILDEAPGISFVTKGDANEDPDSRRVHPEEVVGTVTFVLPYAGYFGDFARSKLGFFLLLAIPAILIIVNEVFRIIKTIKKDKKEKSID